MLLDTRVNYAGPLIRERLLDGQGEKLASSKWASLTSTPQDTAGRDINDLVRRGVLVRESGGGRSTSYIVSV